MVNPKYVQDDPKTQSQRATREQLVLSASGSARALDKGGARKLTRSRSIPSDFRGENTTPLFPGPLLPTVKRLNSTPKTAYSGDAAHYEKPVNQTKNPQSESENSTGLDAGSEAQGSNEKVEVHSLELGKDKSLSDVQSEGDPKASDLQSTSSCENDVNSALADGNDKVNFRSGNPEQEEVSEISENKVSVISEIKVSEISESKVSQMPEIPKSVVESSVKNSGISSKTSLQGSTSNGQGSHVHERRRLRKVSVDLEFSGDADAIRKGRHLWKPTLRGDINGTDQTLLNSQKFLKNEKLINEKLVAVNRLSNVSTRSFRTNPGSKAPQKASESTSNSQKSDGIREVAGIPPSSTSNSEKSDSIGEITSIPPKNSKQEDKRIAVAGSQEARGHLPHRTSSARENLFHLWQKFVLQLAVPSPAREKLSRLTRKFVGQLVLPSSARESLSHLRRKFVGQLALLSKLRLLFGRKYWLFWSVTINLLLSILCLLLFLYAFAMHDHGMPSKGELVKPQENGNSSCDAIADTRVPEAELKVHLQDSLDTGLRSFVLFCSVSLLSLPFLFYKYMDKLAPLAGKSRMRNSEEKAPLSKRIAYRVDVLFSTYAFVKPAALLLATMILILFGGMALYAVSDDSIWDALWRAWTYVADSGNHADSVGLGQRIVSVCISLGGLLIFALMLGLVSDAISEKVDSLRKGKSEVIESNHTLILGWSDKLGSLVKQLAIANKSLGGGVIVVLAERDKEQMELDITQLEFDFMGTSVICRSGSPLIMADLKKVSVSKARSIIVLAEVENADQSDARALRVVLSLSGIKEGLRGHVVVELSDLDNEPLVKLVGGEMVETVVAHDVIGRLMIQCARQPGLAQIWEDVLGFDHAEFYVKRWPQLDGIKFIDILISFPDAIPCGVKVAANGGKIILNPEDDYILSEGDELLVIAEDDDCYFPGPMPQVRKGILPKIVSRRKFPEKILFCGWRRDIDDMIMVLEAFLTVGSELWMFSEVPEKERERKLLDGGLDPSRLENVRLVHREGNAVIRRHLESLPLETFDSILILADEALEDSVVSADSRSLATLLLIRDIQSKRLPYRDVKAAQLRQAGASQSSWIREMQQASNQSIIISEILDSRTKYLVSVSKISDYVLSNELVSMALAMVAEDKQINRVLEELFAEEGNEMYIRPAEFFLYDNEELSFYDIMIRAREREEIVIGYRLTSSERAVINPPNKDAIRKWSLSDVFIVLSQEE